MLNNKIKQIVKTNTIGSVATVSPEGLPCVSPKGMFLVHDDKTLVFAHIRSPGTITNLTSNPNIEVCFVDVFQRIGCRIRGKAEIIVQNSSTAALYTTAFESAWPLLSHLIQTYVVISISEARLLKSPVYDIGMNADELSKIWLQHYQSIYGSDK